MISNLFTNTASRSRLTTCLLAAFVFMASQLSAYSQTFTQTNASEALGKVGQSFSFLLTATTNPTTPFTYTVTNLPPNLSYDPTTATISGTPTLACHRIVRVTPSGTFASNAYDLVIAITPPGDTVYEENFEAFTLGNGNLTATPANAAAPFFTFAITPTFTSLAGDAIQGVTTNSQLNATRLGRLGGNQTSLTFASNTAANFGFFPGIAGTFTRNIRDSGRTLVSLSADVLISRNAGGAAQDFEFFFYDATDASGSISNYHSFVRFTAANTLEVRDGTVGTPYVATGLTYSENTPYQLIMQLDYQLNQWSASLRNVSTGQTVLLANNRSMNVSGWASLVPFDLQTTFTTNSSGTPGNDSILFDNLRFTASAPIIVPPPIVLSRFIRLEGKASFGKHALKSKTVKTFKIRNDGNSILTVTRITLPKGFTGKFKGSISPGQSRSFKVTFLPTAKKTYSGTLRITSDASEGKNSLKINGTGK